MEKVRKLTKEEIEKAIEKKWCPYCKNLVRKFSVGINAWQEFRWERRWDIAKKKSSFKEDWGDIEGGDEKKDVLCYDCGENVPTEVWKKWFNK